MHALEYPRYALPRTLILDLLLALARAANVQNGRSFRRDAQRCMARLHPPLHVLGAEHVPTGGPCLLTMNHYARPGFHAWWIALAISAVVPTDIHWVMTAAWTYPDPLRSRFLTPASRALFCRIASVYGFTPMPPMPPDPQDTMARAVAVRKILAYARETPSPLIAMAPEGADAPGGVLELPPTGVGRFLHLLVRSGLRIVPIGAFEQRGELCLSFGPAYRPRGNTGTTPEQRDLDLRKTVMQHIAQELPSHLRGDSARWKQL